MRIHKLSIQNFRGVEAFEVSFPATGLTVIEGPNEVGKSSLAEGIDLLFDLPDDSRHRRLEAVRPLQPSGGTEVEVEFTTGKYHLRYGKRWFHRPATWLAILEPVQESLVAREAHERAEVILKETLDGDLYRALRFVQGEKVQQGALGASVTLTDALDRAASSGEADSKAESTLWKVVQAERGRYFTETGRGTQERQRVDQAVVEGGNRLESARRLLREMEDTGDSLRATSEELLRLGSRVAEADLQLHAANSAHEQLMGLATKIEVNRAQLQAARLQEERAVDAKKDRDASVAAIDERELRVTALEGAASQRSPELEKLEEAERRAKAELDAAEDARRAVESFVALAEADLEFRRAELDHRLLGNRLERVRESEATETLARRVVENSKATSKARNQVQAALATVAAAKAAREIASPTLDVTALRDQDFALGDETFHLAMGEQRQATVDAETVLALEGVMSVRVSPGRPAQELSNALEDAERRLTELRRRFGLQSADPLAEVNEALEALQKAQRDIDEAISTKAAALEDLTEEQLAAKVHAAKLLSGAYLGQRVSDRSLPTTFEEAEAAYRQSKSEMREAERAVANARAAGAALQEGLQRAHATALTDAERLRSETEQLATERTKLQAARDSRPDTDLDAATSAASASSEEAQRALDKLDSDYRELDPEAVELRFADAQQLVTRLKQERFEASQRETRLRTTLEVQGASDVRDTVERLERELAAREAGRNDLERRASAAALLFDTFGRHREIVRLAYVGPYQKEIERLARLVFGRDTQVQVDPGDLSIKSRTVNGLTIPFDSLSTGAREQLAVIARLACAILVNATAEQSDSGAPILLDDALGYSDPSRLRLLGPAFTSAAQRAQVIVMTCTPDRYQNIGAATIVPMGQGSGSSS